MKFPLIRGRRWPVILLGLLIGLPIVFTIIFALSLPSLAAPTKPIPPVNYQENQVLNYNTLTKLKAGFVAMLQSGTGRGTLELSEAEVNALVSQSLGQYLQGDYKLLGSSTRFADNRIYLDLAVDWHGYTLGPELVVKPQAVGGDLKFVVVDTRLGKLPVPGSYLAKLIQPRLPQGFGLEQQPLGLVFDPDVLVSQVNLPLIKDPRLGIDGLALDNHALSLTAWVSFKIGF